jgi:hypothetical protein
MDKSFDETLWSYRMSDLTDTTKRFLASVECVKTHDLFPKRMLVAAYKLY